MDSYVQILQWISVRNLINFSIKSKCSLTDKYIY